MSGNEYKVERFFLSCDINLPVTFRIERLEGKFPSVKRPISEAAVLDERKPELYVECRLYIDGAPFGLPYKTRLESAVQSYSWSELITLSTKYRDLTAHSQLAFTVRDVSCDSSEGLIGGATLLLFNNKKQLKTGKHKLRLWHGKEADGSTPTTTPGKVFRRRQMFDICFFCVPLATLTWVRLLYVPRGELERLEKLMNKYERGQIQRVEWLDRLTLKAMEKIKEQENCKIGNSQLYLLVAFCSFDHRVVFQESGANFFVPSPIASTNELVLVWDPEVGKPNPSEHKATQASK